jgi:hypothetical protein
VDVLDRAAALYRANFTLFFVLAFSSGAIYFVLQQLVVLASPIPEIPVPPDQQGFAAIAPIVAAYAQTSSVGIVSWFLTLWSTSALVYAISRRHVGLDVTIVEAIRQSFGRLPYLFVTTLVLSLLIGLALVGVWLTFGGLGLGFVFSLSEGVRWGAALSLLAGIGGVALLLAALMGVLLFWLHPATVVIERLGIGAALARSRDLMRQVRRVPFKDRNDVRLTVVLTVLPLLGLAAASLALAPLVLVGVAAFTLHWVDFSSAEQVMSRVMSPLIAVQIAAGALLHPFSTAVTVLFYYDMRYRNEGLDLEMRAMALRKPRARRTAPSAP